MSPELILYPQQLLENPKFATTLNYGWVITEPDSWIKTNGSLTKFPNVSGGNISQSGILVQNNRYRLTFTIANYTGPGNISVKTDGTFTTHLTVTANGSYEVEFTATSDTLIIVFANTVTASIQNTHLTLAEDRFILDVPERTSIPLTFCFDDIDQPDKRKVPFSKTINLPGSNNNNRAMKQIYNLSGESLFRSTIKTRAILKMAGVNVFNGSLSLDRVTTRLKDHTHSSTYATSLLGHSATLFDAIKDKSIKDLDFSEYDHDFTIENISESWRGEVIYNGSFGTRFNRTANYTSPAISSITGVTASYEGISSEFIQITFGSAHSFAVGDDVFIDSNLWQISGDQTIIAVPSGTTIVIGVTKYWIGAAPAASGRVRVWNFNGTGYFYPMCDQGHVHVTADGGSLIVGNQYTIIDYNASDDFTNVGASANLFQETFIAAGTTPASWAAGSILSTPVDVGTEGAEIVSKENTINDWVAQDFIPHVFVWEVWQKMFELADYHYSDTSGIINSNFFKRLIIPLDQKINVAEGDPLAMNDWLPGMKLTEFLMSLLNMFNLVMVPDDEQRTVKILTRGQILSGDVIDWTAKIHAGDPFEITTANTLVPKSYVFKYKDSSDFYNKDYNRDWGDINNLFGANQVIDRKYGDYALFPRNDYGSKTTTVQIQFEPTIQAGPMQPNVHNGTILSTGIYSESDKTLSVCYYADEFGQNIKRQTANRIFLAEMRGTATAWSLTSPVTPGDDESDVVFGTSNVRLYPFAGHTVNKGEAKYSILFGQPAAVYFPWSGLAALTAQNKDLYEICWSRWISQVSSQYARKAEGTFKLTAADIANLDFTKLYRVGDAVMILNRVSDWDMASDGLCRCEFIIK